MRTGPASKLCRHERLKAAFTGAGSVFYDPSREAMKMACHSAGVRFPAYVTARHAADAEHALSELRFPIIVKHPNSYSSIGLTRGSCVTNASQLRRETGRMIEQFGAALIEEFIDGRELTVLVTEARHEGEIAWTLNPVEFCFPEGESFKHFDLKWKEFDRMETRVVTDAVLAERLTEAARLTFAALGGSGYGRCDLRMDQNGDIYMLEINPNCGLFYPEEQFGSADFVLANDPAGHRGFLEHILACGIRRRERCLTPWQVRYRRDSGFGMFATRALEEGETAVRYEEHPHVLASRRHVERAWTGLKRQWFEHYAWPVAAGLHVLWSENPDDWRPINHSCDPNTWLDGLDLVARRGIALGEELTVDYATFCGPSMAGFECQCDAPHCCLVITSSDHLHPGIRQGYHGHVSEFVSAAWLNAAPNLQPLYEAASKPHGIALVARRSWRVGEIISPLSWTEPRSLPDRWTIQRGPEHHAEPLPFELRYINHSCEPNVQFDIDANVLRVVKDIEPGEELAFFYPSTEWSMAECFECQCRAEGCIGYIAGASQLPLDILARYSLSSVIRGKLESARQVSPKGFFHFGDNTKKFSP